MTAKDDGPINESGERGRRTTVTFSEEAWRRVCRLRGDLMMEAYPANPTVSDTVNFVFGSTDPTSKDFGAWLRKREARRK